MQIPTTHWKFKTKALYVMRYQSHRIKLHIFWMNSSGKNTKKNPIDKEYCNNKNVDET